MKRYPSYLIVSLLAVLICSCAQWGGDNPLGITGGGEEGYGQNNDLNLPEVAGEIDPDLVGSWGTSEGLYMTVFTFSADGTFTIEQYYDGDLQDTTEGNWSVSGNTLLLGDHGNSATYNYSINSNRLTLYNNEYELILYRMKRVD